jgi:hypothetical protein
VSSGGVVVVVVVVVVVSVVLVVVVPQVLPLSHADERQTVLPLIVVHGPSPSRSPHLLSATSQVPLVQTREAADEVQVPLRVGAECGGSFGIGPPLKIFGEHVLEVS